MILKTLYRENASVDFFRKIFAIQASANLPELFSWTKTRSADTVMPRGCSSINAPRWRARPTCRTSVGCTRACDKSTSASLSMGRTTLLPLLEHAASTLRSRLLSCISAFVCVHTGLLTTKVVLPIVLFDFKLDLEIPDSLVTNHVGRLSKDGP